MTSPSSQEPLTRESLSVKNKRTINFLKGRFHTLGYQGTPVAEERNDATMATWKRVAAEFERFPREVTAEDFSQEAFDYALRQTFTFWSKKDIFFSDNTRVTQQPEFTTTMREVIRQHMEQWQKDNSGPKSTVKPDRSFTARIYEQYGVYPTIQAKWFKNNCRPKKNAGSEDTAGSPSSGRRRKANSSSTRGRKRKAGASTNPDASDAVSSTARPSKRRRVAKVAARDDTGSPVVSGQNTPTLDAHTQPGQEVVRNLNPALSTPPDPVVRGSSARDDDAPLTLYTRGSTEPTLVPPDPSRRSTTTHDLSNVITSVSSPMCDCTAGGYFCGSVTLAAAAEMVESLASNNEARPSRSASAAKQSLEFPDDAVTRPNDIGPTPRRRTKGPDLRVSTVADPRVPDAAAPPSWEDRTNLYMLADVAATTDLRREAQPPILHQTIEATLARRADPMKIEFIMCSSSPTLDPL